MRAKQNGSFSCEERKIQRAGGKEECYGTLPPTPNRAKREKMDKKEHQQMAPHHQ